MKYKVQLQAVVTANVWVECSDEHEAVSIAENAWKPCLDGAGIDDTIEAIYDYRVDGCAEDVFAYNLEHL